MIKGQTQLFNISEDEVCRHIPGYTMLFPEKKTFIDSISWCDKLRGDIALPTSLENNIQIFDKFIEFNNECFDVWQALYWVGASGNVSSGQWLRLIDDQPIHWHNFKDSWESVTDKYSCILAGGILHPYEWYHAPCTVIACVMCNFTSHPEVHLRGLCESSLFDRSLFLHEYINNRPKFDGARHSSIIWNNKSWVMESRLYPQLSAKMVDQMDYPVGLHLWNIRGDKCRQKEVYLLLTACRADEFTCDDGTCIDKSQRCDLSTDCPDHTDELTCDVMAIPEGYSAQLPPPKITLKPVPLLFHLNITSIREFNVVSFTLTIDVIITIRWNDSRVTFTNLQEDHRKNKVKQPGLLWTPELMVTDGTQSWVQHGQTDGGDLYVVKMTPPMADNNAVLHEDDVYSGSNNSLLYRLHKTLKSRCQLDLESYPFDTQRCSLFFTVQGITDFSGKLDKEGAGLTFAGTRQLLEYNLVDETIHDITEEQVTQMKVRLKFTNLYKYYTMNAFLPSTMMLVISYFSLYFDLEDFQDRIMVSLTSLLVLAAFFSQTSLTIPKTSYLKLIDVWYVALISYVFFVIISLIFVENLRLRDIKQQQCPHKTIQVTPFAPGHISSKELATTIHTNSLPARLNCFLIVFFPLAFFVFFVYFVAACADGLKE
ncbi:glycine receptor subunit alpha-2-like [Homarus americanus]|uniref:glycine receptor subunit alpha-2-like n=1 Tax=Homarus americanus TaxID=6706 RepID=UPI001C46747F|nr:glycine receptor subunit alpha-2-like [Homarus americanus]